MYSNQHIESLSSEGKREALGRLLQSKLDEARSYPLTSGQHAMWFQQQLEPQSPAYNIPLVFCITGNLRVEALRQSLDVVVKRHHSLRTVFSSENGHPLQRVQPESTIDLLVYDLESAVEADWKAQVLRLSSRQSSEPMDLAKGPLFRFELLRLSETQHALLITIHHIVLDGWSIGVLQKEFAEVYVALVAGKPSPLPPLRVQFSDFVQWELRKLQGPANETHIAYWKEHMRDSPVAFELPTDFSRPPLQTFRGASYPFTLPSSLTQELKALGRQTGATFFMTMLTSFYVLLLRLSGEEDIVVGTSIANREREEFRGLLGLFANTVPMRADLSGDPTFIELLERVRLCALEDYLHTDVPLAKLVEELKPVRDPSRNVLFQVAFDFQNSPWHIVAGEEGNVVTLLNGDNGAAKLDFNLSMSQNEQGLVGALEYSTDLFAESTINRWVACYQRLLESIVDNPATRLSELEILSSANRRQVLDDWNRTWHPHPSDVCIHELFERQVRRSPDHAALIQGETSWSYLELDQRANRVACALRDAGVGPESIVGLCGERSLDLISGLLGVLKAGGCYLPLDPALPFDRLTYMAQDAGVDILLTTRELAQEWHGDNLEIVYLDLNNVPAGPQRFHARTDLATSGNLAYVVYTSGSTGRPKGVMVSHASLVNHALSTGAEFRLTPADRVLQFASVSFDASAEEIFASLTHGATLVLRTDEMLSSPATFLQTCTDWEITVLDLPTSYWHQLIKAMAAEKLVVPPALRLMVLGGESAAADLVNAWREHIGARVRLLNTYGPTEATIVATISDLSNTSCADPRYHVSIGQPISNVSVYILDTHGNPVPPGVYGEILLGGAGVARGYLNRPKLTAERFIPDPFSIAPGARLYRSGDIGRHMPNGSLEFKGRVDGQVKLRGFRIELGELEAVLNQHPAVDQAVVLVREDQPGTRRLAAYVVCHPERSASVSELRDWMRKQLPEHMVPATLVTMEALPKSISGKVDRRALLALHPLSVDIGKSQTAPRRPSEEIVAGIWAEVLGVDQVGVHDNFFELGGHSLLATQVISRVRRVMRVEVPLYSVFEASTVARFVQVIESNRWLKQGLAPPPMVSLPRIKGAVNVFAQSFAQQRLWFLDQLEPNTATYNLPTAVKMQGELNLQALEESLNEIIRRHEILRTTFREQDGQPVQVIAPDLKMSVPVNDLAGLGTEEREEAVRRLANAGAHRTFDLLRGPLIRMEVLRLGELEHVLLFTMHHIVSDAWSMGVLVRELDALYPAFCASQPSPLPDIELQYADFAQWQREWLSGTRLDQQIEYWRGCLEGAPANLNLPTVRHNKTGSLAGSSLSYTLSSQLTESIKVFSRSESVTPFMTLLAAFGALLHRYTGQLDIVVGTPIANRYREELEPLIGFFINTLVMRINLPGDLSFLDLVGRVRETALGAYEHQDLPFEKLVEQLGLGARSSGTPLFRVMFVLQNAPMPLLDLPGIRLTALPLENRAVMFDLILEVVENPTGFVTIARYSTELFEQESMRRMLEHYQLLLEGALKNPDTLLSELPILSSGERQQLLQEWNRTDHLHSNEKSVHEMFEEQAERSPDLVAVGYENQELTYAELNRRSNQLGHYLRDLGVGPEVRVGICVRRSLEMVVGLLGILKAGGAYVPLDPGYPAERLSYMLEDAQVQVLLTQRSLKNQLQPSRVQVVCLDEAWQQPGPECEKNLKVRTTAENLAYVIYTSGSTGKPKGVEITNTGLFNLVQWHNRSYKLNCEDRMTQYASLSFDAAVWEIWPTLVAGARLQIVDDAIRLAPSHLVSWMLQQKITITFLPTPVLEALLTLNWPAETTVRRVLTGGDKLHHFHGKSLPFTVINHYGPTENTVVATSCTIVDGEGEDSMPPIGGPIANTKVYVLDAQMELVPIGVEGELYTGGAGLARGYLNRPGLTAERFVPNLFSTTGGERLYRTGDLVRWRADGNLEFIGRVDHQVKLRGYRVELGEIEAALYEQPGVRRTVVLAREDNPGDKRLVAYVEREHSDAPTAEDLKGELKKYLPDYMVPAAFVFLDALPLAINGKVNREALPAPELPEAQREYVAPRTPVEEALCGIWADVLHRERVGVDDNFFELGGDSLLAMQVVSRVRNVLRLELPLFSLLEEPAIRGLGQLIDRNDWKDKPLIPAPLPLVREGQGTQVLPQSVAQQRVWFQDQLEPNTATYNLPSAVRLCGELNVGALEESLNELVRRHESLRTTFASQVDQLVQIIAPELRLKIAISNLEPLSKGEREVKAQQFLDAEAQRPFDLTRGPLLRVAIVGLAEQEHILLFNIHHIIADGWSLGVIVRELSILYASFCEGRPSPLLPLSLKESDFFLRQQEWLKQGALDSQLAYWQARLKGAPRVLELPANQRGVTGQSGRGATAFTLLSPALTQSLKLLSRQEGVTLFMVLIAALKVLLARYSGQLDIVVGTPIANRHWEETESLVALLTNSITLRTDLSGNPSFHDLLGRVREVALSAYDNQDLPFEQLVEQLGPERRWSRTPIFQIMFALQNAPMPPLELVGLVPTSIPLANKTTMFDLTMEVVEYPTGMIAAFQYNTDLFDEETVKRMLEHYRMLLDGVVKNPNACLSELPMLSASERGQLLLEWNSTAREYPSDKGFIHQQIEQQALLHPQTVALTFEGEAMTYGELDRRSNQLAWKLLSLGAGVGTLVGVCMERSLEMVIALLSVLKSGAAYVPLDPGYPKARLAYMMEDTQVPVLLIQENLRGQLPEHQSRVLCLDTDWEREMGEYASGPVQVEVTKEDLAYVIYTSGSTGQPKGAMNTHGGIRNRLLWMQETYSLTAEDRVLQKTPFSFDVSVWEFFWPLMEGARLVMARPGGHQDSRYLATLMREEKITTVHFVPSVLQTFLEEDGLAECGSLKRVMCSGEALPLELKRYFFTRLQCELHNLYGPTEAAVDVTHWECAKHDAMQVVPIGRPIANAQMYVLDTEMKLVAVGMSGELYIGGVGLARGYWNRAALTGEKFVPNPFALADGERLYRTGDLVRWRTDGTLEFIGRIDHQVKLRGYRIELGEIEAALECHETVKQAVVIVREDQPGMKRLVGYLVKRTEAEGLNIDELRRHLNERLPEYMVPAVLVELEKVPLSPNGKVDRRALPAPEVINARPKLKFVGAETPAEVLLAEIWSELLKVDPVGIHDNFFELGGHSLLATQLVSRVRRSLHVEVPLRQFFEAPTINGLLIALSGMAGGRPAVERIAQTYTQICRMSADEVNQLLAVHEPA